MPHDIFAKFLPSASFPNTVEAAHRFQHRLETAPARGIFLILHGVLGCDSLVHSPWPIPFPWPLVLRLGHFGSAHVLCGSRCVCHLCVCVSVWSVAKRVLHLPNGKAAMVAFWQVAANLALFPQFVWLPGTTCAHQRFEEPINPKGDKELPQPAVSR